MKRKIIFACLLSIMTCGLGLVNAQVKDVSMTVSPLIQYQWWNKNINLENNMFYGLRAGFGFGPYFELRAVAEKSLDIQGKLRSSSWNLSESLINKLPDHTVDITRLSGEAKFNILSGLPLSPYILAGAGIQYFKYDPFTEGLDERDYKEQQIFASLGVGIKMNLSPRVVFSLEGKQLLFNMDPMNAYFNPNIKNKNSRLANYAALASLDIYLGGANREFTSSLDKRVRDSYTSGFLNGIKFVAEPSIAYVNFNENLPYADQWFMGGTIGMDFSSLVGIRGYYYQATDDPDKLAFKFNKNLKMYGVNMLARLNQPRGIVPYLQFGGGYLDTRGSVYGSDELKESFDKNNLFLQLGGGIEMPISRYFALFGTANAMLMAQKGVSPEKLKRPSQIRTSMMYTAGLRINLGSPVKSGTDLYQSALESERERSRAEINELRAEYEGKLNALNAELAEALERGDEARVEELMEQRRKVTGEAQSSVGKGSMTAGEFEELVNRVIEKIMKEKKTRRTSSLSDADFGLLLEALRQDKPVAASAASQAQVSSNDALLIELRSLAAKMDRNYETLRTNATAPASTTTVVVPSSQAVAPVQPSVVVVDKDGTSTQAAPQVVLPAQNPSVIVVDSVVTVDKDGALTDKPVTATPDGSDNGNLLFLRYRSVAPMFGINFGEQLTANIGIRGYLQVNDSQFDFVPEAFIALGRRFGYGFSGNVIYNVSSESDSPISPYFGLGLGLFKQHTSLKAGTNIILGTNLKMGNNSLFVDYTIRNFFRNNQFSIGYRFIF